MELAQKHPGRIEKAQFSPYVKGAVSRVGGGLEDNAADVLDLGPADYAAFPSQPTNPKLAKDNEIVRGFIVISGLVQRTP
jgi:hypothetical protein